MKILLKRNANVNIMKCFIKVELTEDDIHKINRLNLWSCKINDKSNSILTASNSINANSFSQQVSSIRNRWQSAITRTTGFVFFDVLLIFLRTIARIVIFIFRLIFGTNINFRQLQKGINLKASTIEKLREKETNVLVSIAAVHRAFEMIDVDTEFEFKGLEYLSEVPGLRFTGDLSNLQLGSAAMQDWISQEMEAEQELEEEIDMEQEETPEIDVQ